MEDREKNYGVAGDREPVGPEPAGADPADTGQVGAEKAATDQATADQADPPQAEPEASGPAENDPAGYGPAGYDPVGYGPVGSVGIGPVGPQTREEKTWSVLAHLSTFLNVFTLFLGPVAAAILWLVYKDRSERIAFNALQAALYQGAWIAFLFIGWAVTGLLTVILIGFLFVPVMVILTLVPLVHGAYAAYRVSKDGEYRYPLVADLIER